jgi:hypothetical protein
MTGNAGLLFSMGKKINGFLVILCFLLTVGCVTVAIIDVGYTENQISVRIENPFPSSEATLQVTIYQIKDLHQQEIVTLWNTSTLMQGSTTIILPQHLDSGTYKIYVYLLQNGQRKTAVIHDIVV